MKLRKKLRGRSKIECWADKYNVANDTCIETLVPEVEQRGHLTKCELIEVSKWVLQKTGAGRRQLILDRVEPNSPDDVEKWTKNAFLLTNDSDSIRCLEQNLKGVGWVTASAILHWFHERPYPTWTPHAKWAVKLDPKLDLSSTRWQDYVNYCRTKADQYEVDMRTLDRAFRECGKANMS